MTNTNTNTAPSILPTVIHHLERVQQWDAPRLPTAGALDEPVPGTVWFAAESFWMASDEQIEDLTASLAAVGIELITDASGAAAALWRRVADQS